MSDGNDARKNVLQFGQMERVAAWLRENMATLKSGLVTPGQAAEMAVKHAGLDFQVTGNNIRYIVDQSETLERWWETPHGTARSDRALFRRVRDIDERLEKLEATIERLESLTDNRVADLPGAA